MDKKQISYISRWFIKNHEVIKNEIGEEATRKLCSLMTKQGISLVPKRSGRPKANSELRFIPGGDVDEIDIVDAVLNYRVKDAATLAQLFGILIQGGYLTPETPMKSFYNFWMSRERFPWEPSKPICTYKSLTEAVSKPENKPTKGQKTDFDFLTVKFACIRKERENYEQSVEVGGELYTTDEFQDYLSWLNEEARD